MVVLVEVQSLVLIIINPGELHRKYPARETLKMLKTIFKLDWLLAEFLNISEWICEKIINPRKLHRNYLARETLKMLKTVLKLDWLLKNNQIPENFIVNIRQLFSD